MTLVEASQGAGSRSVVWNGRGYSGRRLPSGTYIVRLQTNIDSGSMKILLID
jgi:flagellar hook assembly protein FlgD